jgi:hypothetical protein
LWDIADPANRGEHLPVPAVLHRFAHDLTGTAARGWLYQWLHRDGRTCIGIELLFEAWAAPTPPNYRRGDLATSPADREVRVVAAVDTDLGLHQVIRTRGQQPTVHSWPHLPAWSRPSRRRHRPAGPDRTGPNPLTATGPSIGFPDRHRRGTPAGDFRRTRDTGTPVLLT